MDRGKIAYQLSTPTPGVEISGSHGDASFGEKLYFFNDNDIHMMSDFKYHNDVC